MKGTLDVTIVKRPHAVHHYGNDLRFAQPTEVYAVYPLWSRLRRRAKYYSYNGKES